MRRWNTLGYNDTHSDVETTTSPCAAFLIRVEGRTNERRFVEIVAGIMGPHGVYFMTQTIPDFHNCPGRPSF
jgi:hypothetical protein